MANRRRSPYNRPSVGEPIHAKVLRLLDANANRAREALRVLEDYTRFVLDDEKLSARLKQLRHELTAATRPFLADAILHRDTPGDVGTSIKLDSELHREEITDVVIAAGKRLGEALRAMEEYCKTFDVAAARCSNNRDIDSMTSSRQSPARCDPAIFLIRCGCMC